MKKVWYTGKALTEGILYVSARRLMDVWVGGWNDTTRYPAEYIHTQPYAAIAHAKQLQAAEVKRLKAELARVQALKFD